MRVDEEDGGVVGKDVGGAVAVVQVKVEDEHLGEEEGGGGPFRWLAG